MNRKIKKIIKNPRKIVRALARRGFFNFLSDEAHMKLVYYFEMGKKLDLDNPKDFNEKLQWLKLHDRKPVYTEWVDKAKAKELVKELIGEKYVVPMLFRWEKAEDIDFSSLPDKCILKCNHDQGSTMIYERSRKQDCEDIKRYFKKKLKKNPFYATREWPYKDVKSCVICEPYLGDNIVDYKIFCFNGEPYFVNIGQKDVDKDITHVSFLTLDWEWFEIQRSDYAPVEEIPKKPERFDEMLELARKLSKDTKFVRVDFFYVNDNIYFSEYTLYPTSGLIKFSPNNGDEKLGRKLSIM